jgi:hypothetical protein
MAFNNASYVEVTDSVDASELRVSSNVSCAIAPADTIDNEYSKAIIRNKETKDFTVITTKSL